MEQTEVFGELLTVRQTHRYVNGSRSGKGAVIGEKALRELLRRGTIKRMMRNGRYFVRKRDVDNFLELLSTKGCAELGISVH